MFGILLPGLPENPDAQFTHKTQEIVRYGAYSFYESMFEPELKYMNTTKVFFTQNNDD